jgi:hypothetical protein
MLHDRGITSSFQSVNPCFLPTTTKISKTNNSFSATSSKEAGSRWIGLNQERKLTSKGSTPYTSRKDKGEQTHELLIQG